MRSRCQFFLKLRQASLGDLRHLALPEVGKVDMGALCSLQLFHESKK